MQDNVWESGYPEYPPNASAEVWVPAPAKHVLAVVKPPPADQDAPLYS